MSATAAPEMPTHSLVTAAYAVGGGAKDKVGAGAGTSGGNGFPSGNDTRATVTRACTPEAGRVPGCKLSPCGFYFYFYISIFLFL